MGNNERNDDERGVEKGKAVNPANYVDKDTARHMLKELARYTKGKLREATEERDKHHEKGNIEKAENQQGRRVAYLLFEQQLRFMAEDLKLL
jgi:hypothetical protein